MQGIARFGVSLDKDLSVRFDNLIRKRKWKNRSEAFRKLIKKELVQDEWLKDQQTAGAIVFVYDHHKRELLNKIMHLQHDYSKLILSTQHIHLDHYNCLEVVVIKGRPSQVNELQSRLNTLKGMKCISLAMASTGKEIP